GQRLAHVAGGAASISRGMSRTGVFRKQQICIWPISATVVLALLGWGVRRAIETTMKDSLRSQLQTLLTVETAMLDNWMKTQSSNATSLANDQQVRESIHALLANLEADEGANPQHPPAEL